MKMKMKKKALKMTSQLVIFRAFFFFFSVPDPKSEKKSGKGDGCTDQILQGLLPKLYG